FTFSEDTETLAVKAMSWPLAVTPRVEDTEPELGPVAVIIAEVEFATAFVVTEKAAVVAPAGMVTLFGTVAAEVLLLDRVIAAPPAGAGAVAWMVPCDGLPPITGFGESCKFAIVGPVPVPQALVLNVASPVLAESPAALTEVTL